MFSYIKSWGKRLGLAAVASLSIASSGCELMSPEGVQVYKKADGVISHNEEKSLAQLIENNEISKRAVLQYIDEDKRITDFETGPLQNLVNDINVHFVQEFADQGLQFQRYGKDLHVYFAKNLTELREKGSGENDAAFFNMAKDTIYIPLSFQTDNKDNIAFRLWFSEFIRIFQHEAGHYLRQTTQELNSMAHEMYSMLKLYNMNKKLGSLTVLNFISILPKLNWKTFNENFSKHERAYVLGMFNLYATMNWTWDNDGNLVPAHRTLEQALNYILNAPVLHQQKLVIEVLNKYKDMREASFKELERLVNAIEFKQSFRNLTGLETEELKRYIILKAYERRIWYDLLEDFKTDDLEEKFVELSEDFLKKYSNPLFKAEVTRSLSDYYYRKLSGYLNNFSENVYNVYSLSKRIVEMYKDYPCDYKFYECPLTVSKFNPSMAHAKSYAYLLGYFKEFVSNGFTTYEDLAGLADEFLQKFYPDGDYKYSADNNVRSSNLPLIALFAGLLYVDRSLYEAQTNDEMKEYCEKAKFWFEVMKSSSCEVLDNNDDIESCRRSLNYINYYDYAEKWLAALDCGE